MAANCRSLGSKTRVVLLSCGSFNPITFLHLRMFGNDIIIAKNLMIFAISGHFVDVTLLL